MIKANELRIGNLLKFNDEILPVYSFNNNLSLIIAGTPQSNIAYGSDSVVVEPIPLTEEWLMKFDFENWSEGNWRPRERYDIFDSDYINYYLPYYTMDIHIGTIGIKYVHQLQNLYFALTGEELKL